jgi:hypothetical protein
MFHRAAVLSIVFLILPAGLATAWAEGITLENFNPGETIRYPVAFLRGTIEDKSARGITVINESSERPTKELRGIVYKGRYKALTELVPGPNRLVLRAGSKDLKITLNYKPQTNPYYVEVIYMTDSSGNTKYQTQRRNDPQNYQAKLDTDLKLLQSFTAEQMNQLGFGRLTFNLKFDKDGRLEVHKLVSEHAADFFYPLDTVQLFLAIRGEVEKTFNSPRTKRAVYTAFSRYDPLQNKLVANNARGGGGTAECGTAGMWTWPSSLGGVFAAFSDRTPINTRIVGDDSDGRGTAWGMAATYMAVMLHELQHTWELPHTHNPYDVISGRGFKDINRFFTFLEPPCKSNPRYFAPPQSQASCIAAISGSALKNSRWFALDDKPWKDGDAPRFSAYGKEGDILIEAKHGLGYLGLDVKGDTVAFETWGYDHPKPPTRYRLTARELRELTGTTDVKIRAFDLEGQKTETEAKKLGGK